LYRVSADRRFMLSTKRPVGYGGVSDLGALATSTCARRSIKPKHAALTAQPHPLTDVVLVETETGDEV
jgi:hypothetical protein